ncbi:Ig-like domain-containing protein [Actinoplanes sp. NPDC051861]|uniref:Ig-like domain-containing protein n=1 Tax=Actinoplanes sp. NPDC051861 TaxID=3155170 RepID=UPI003430C418
MRGRCAGILFLVMAVMLTTLPAGRVEAAITEPFTTRFDVNANGSILLRGNANLTCPVSILTPTCTDARTGVGSTATEELNDNGYPMIFTDTDGDPATFNDSTASVTMPAGSAVLFAGLYWGADPSAGNAVAGLLGAAAPTPSDKNKVLFRTPAGAIWNPITASDVYTISASGPYQGFADVTSLVAGAGDGVYGVANIQSGRGADRYAGWTLVIAYRNPAEDLRSLRVYDGFGSISSGSVSIPVTGFETPHSGTVRAEVGAVAYEGDLGKSGDGLRLNGQSLSDAANPSNNVFNSTVSDGGAIVGGRNPNHRNLFGVDIDQLDASGVLGNAATSATLTMSTAGETYYPGVITIAIDLYAPKIVTTMTATDVNGGTLVPGDEIEYRIAVRNEGNDIADGVTLADAFPVYTTYVPGTMTIAGTPVSDVADADNGQAGGGSAVFRLGSIPYLGTTYVTFRVKVDLNTPAGYSISNLVNVSYTGRTTSVAVAAAGGTSATPVLQPSADVAAGLSVTPAFVQRASAPHAVAYTASVTNLGPQPEPSARAELTLPTGVTPGPLPGTCAAAGQVVTCVLGPLLSGHTATVTVPADVTSAAGADATAGVRVSGAGSDSAPGNDTATATLAVNSPPQATADSATTTNGAPVSVDVRANDTDTDDATGALTVSVLTQPSHGAAVVVANGTVTYTPTPGWTGADTFTYQVDDGNGGTDTATVTVTTANALPVASDDEINTPPATPVVVAVLLNDTDPNPLDVLTVTGFGQPQAGAGTVTQAGPLLTYTPAVAFTGRAHFTYTVQDSHGGQATGNVYVDVANQAPTAADDAVTTPYLTDVLIDVLANDTDPNLLGGDVLSIDTVGTPGFGTATIDTGRIRYQPPAGYSGTVVFAYTIRDLGLANATATVAVTVSNAQPTAADQAVGTAYGTFRDINVLSSATDPNTTDVLRVSGTTNPSDGTVQILANGRIRYTPDAGFSGVDTFQFTIDDGHGGTDVGLITVTVANGLPVARADAVTVQAGVPLEIDVMANDDDDPNGDPVTMSITAPPAHGTVTVGADRRIRYAPGALGADQFDYTLSDGQGSSTATVTIGVVNSAPVARADSVATDTNAAITVDVLANDDDPNGDNVALVGTTAAAHGTVVRNGNGTLTYTPVAGFYGMDAIAYTIEDPARLSSSAILTITVRNAPPIALDDGFVVDQGVTTQLNLLGNDSDPNVGQVLSVASVGAAVKGAVVLHGNGTVTYQSAAAAAGQDLFTYVVSDDLGRTDTGLVTLTINVAVPPGPSTPSAGPSGAPTAGPSGVPSPTGVPSAGPSGGPAPSSSAGPTAPSAGPTSPGGPASPGGPTSPGGPAGPSSGPSSPGSPRPTPAVPDRAAATDPGAPVAVPLPATDLAGRPVSVVAVGMPANGTVKLNADGTVTYTPNPGFSGTDSFTYTVIDANGNVAQGTIVVEVGAASPSPTVSPTAPPAPAPTPPPPGHLPTTGQNLMAVLRIGALAIAAGIALHWAAGIRRRP